MNFFVLIPVFNVNKNFMLNFEHFEMQTWNVPPEHPLFRFLITPSRVCFWGLMPPKVKVIAVCWDVANNDTDAVRTTSLHDWLMCIQQSTIRCLFVSLPACLSVCDAACRRCVALQCSSFQSAAITRSALCSAITCIAGQAPAILPLTITLRSRCYFSSRERKLKRNKDEINSTRKQNSKSANLRQLAAILNFDGSRISYGNYFR